MAKQKLKWTDTEEIAFRLIDEHPSIDPLRVRFTDLHKYITSLPDFGDNPKKSTESVLEAIQMRWHEERSEMEDELGPVSSDEEGDLDEDDYRDDEEAAEDDVAAGSFDDDEDDEFGDGFQEEEIEDDR